MDRDTAALVNEIEHSLAQHNTPGNERLIDEYYTTIADQLQVVPELPAALAIHALGDIGRAEWIAALEKTPYHFALTTNPELSEYQFWSLHQQWWIYRRIIMHFNPVYVDTQHVIWKRRSGGERQSVTADVGCRLTRSGPKTWRLELSEADERFLYEVVVRTTGELTGKAFLRLSWQHYSAVTKKPDFGSVALDGEIRFPFRGGVAAQLTIEIVGPDEPSNFQPNTCDVLSTQFTDKRYIYRESSP